MPQLIAANNAQTTLAGSISNIATTANLASGSGILFAAPGANQYFVGTFTDAATGLLHEIVFVTNVTGDTITMERAQEGTTALNWSANDLFGNLMTAGQLETMVQAFEAQTQSYNYGVDTGVVNAYVVVYSPDIASAPSAGTPLRFSTIHANTGASTLNAGWGAAAIVRRDGSALIGNEILATGINEVIWNGAQFVFEGIAPATTSAITTGTDTNSAVTPAQLANASFAPTGSFLVTGSVQNQPGYYLCDGTAYSRSTDSNLFNSITKSSVVTLNIASPGVVNWTGHGLVNGAQVAFETTGSLPTGIAVGTIYYVTNASTNSFNVAATPGGAAINFTGSQTGTQTCRYCPYGCGDGVTTFNVPDARGRIFFGGDSMMGGAFANRITSATVNPPLAGGAGGAESRSVSLSVSTSVSVSVSVFGSSTTGGASAESSVGSLPGGNVNTWTNPHTHGFSLTSSGSGGGSGSGSATGTVITMPPVLGTTVWIRR